MVTSEFSVFVNLLVRTRHLDIKQGELGVLTVLQRLIIDMIKCSVGANGY